MITSADLAKIKTMINKRRRRNVANREEAENIYYQRYAWFPRIISGTFVFLDYYYTRYHAQEVWHPRDVEFAMFNNNVIVKKFKPSKRSIESITEKELVFRRLQGKVKDESIRRITKKGSR